jgi:hypothetical protein
MTTSEQLCKQLDALYKSYAAAFSSEDVVAISKSVGCPCALISGQQGLDQLATESDLLAYVEQLSDRRSKNEDGFARNSIS